MTRRANGSKRKWGRFAICPRGLTAPHGWEREPLGHRPDVISQACGHRRASRSPAALIVLSREGSHRPAEIVDVQGQVGDGLMKLPMLREPVRLASLPGVAMPV